jgi:hypothetical protein
LFFAEVYKLTDDEFFPFIENVIANKLQPLQKKWAKDTMADIASDLGKDDTGLEDLDESSNNNDNKETKVIPELKDKLTANAVRVPTPNGSLAILSLELAKKTSIEEINAVIKDAALNGDLVNQIYYSFDPELVSSDIIGNTCCSVFDSNATIASLDGKNIVLYAWYDNEFGYTKQVIRLAKYITKVRRAIYY